MRIFREHRNRSLIWCESGLDSTLRSCATCAWISPFSEASSWTRILQRSHIPTGAVAALSTVVWTLHHLKYTHLEGQVVRTNTAWNRRCRTLPSGTALSLYDNRITPIIITDITGRRNVRIQNPYTCTTSSESHVQRASRGCYDDVTCKPRG